MKIEKSKVRIANRNRWKNIELIKEIKLFVINRFGNEIYSIWF